MMMICSLPCESKSFMKEKRRELFRSWPPGRRGLVSGVHKYRFYQRPICMYLYTDKDMICS